MHHNKIFAKSQTKEQPLKAPSSDSLIELEFEERKPYTKKMTYSQDYTNNSADHKVIPNPTSGLTT